jgi:hypothetical protein
MSTKNILAYGLLIILILFSVNLILGYQVYDDSQEAKGKTWEAFDGIFGSKTVGQTFVSRYDELSRIDIALATYARTNTKEVVFHLREHVNSTVDIVKISINASTVIDNSHYTFSFSPIHNSKNRVFYFFLESPNSTPTNCITVWYTPSDSYPDGGIVSVNVEPKLDGDLIFRTYYWVSFSDVLSGFAQRILENFAFFFPLYLLISLLIFFSIKLHFSGRKIFISGLKHGN